MPVPVDRTPAVPVQVPHAEVQVPILQEQAQAPVIPHFHVQVVDEQTVAVNISDFTMYEVNVQDAECQTYPVEELEPRRVEMMTGSRLA